MYLNQPNGKKNSHVYYTGRPNDGWDDMVSLSCSERASAYVHSAWQIFFNYFLSFRCRWMWKYTRNPVRSTISKLDLSLQTALLDRMTLTEPTTLQLQKLTPVTSVTASQWIFPTILSCFWFYIGFWDRRRRYGTDRWTDRRAPTSPFTYGRKHNNLPVSFNNEPLKRENPKHVLVKQ